VGVYSVFRAPTFLRGCLRIILLHCRASIRRGSCWTTLDTEESLFGSIELLWTLKSHSLGQSEDQDEMSPFWVNQKTKLRCLPFGSIRRPCWEGILSLSQLPYQHPWRFFILWLLPYDTILFHHILVTFHVSRISSFEIPFSSYNSSMLISFYLSVPSTCTCHKWSHWGPSSRYLVCLLYRFLPDILMSNVLFPCIRNTEPCYFPLHP
jgi:hypothetical protein